MKNQPTPKFQFSNVVVVDENLIGCIVKTWGASMDRGVHYEVYVRSYNRIEEYDEKDIKHFVYDKELESPPKQEVQTIRKGQVFVTQNHGRVIFEGFDFAYGECTAKLRGVDHSGTYYPKLETLSEFQFIDN